MRIIIFYFVDGKIEVFTKHDHTQYKLLVDAVDPKYSILDPIRFISLASFDKSNIHLYSDCSIAPPSINTELATKYASFGHPLLLEDPTFRTPADKRVCKFNRE